MLLITLWGMPHVADKLGELAVQCPICLLCEMSPLLWIMSGRRRTEHYTMDTMAAWRSGPRLPMAVRAQAPHGGQGLARWPRLANWVLLPGFGVCSMRHKDERSSDIFCHSSSRKPCVCGGTLWQYPAVGPPGHNVLLKKVDLHEAWGFSQISESDSWGPVSSGGQRDFFSKFQFGLIEPELVQSPQPESLTHLWGNRLQVLFRDPS